MFRSVLRRPEGGLTSDTAFWPDQTRLTVSSLLMSSRSVAENPSSLSVNSRGNSHLFRAERDVLTTAILTTAHLSPPGMLHASNWQCEINDRKSSVVEGHFGCSFADVEVKSERFQPFPNIIPVPRRALFVLRPFKVSSFSPEIRSCCSFIKILVNSGILVLAVVEFFTQFSTFSKSSQKIAKQEADYITAKIETN